MAVFFATRYSLILQAVLFATIVTVYQPLIATIKPHRFHHTSVACNTAYEVSGCSSGARQSIFPRGPRGSDRRKSEPVWKDGVILKREDWCRLSDCRKDYLYFAKSIDFNHASMRPDAQFVTEAYGVWTCQIWCLKASTGEASDKSHQRPLRVLFATEAALLRQWRQVPMFVGMGVIACWMAFWRPR